MKRRGYIDITIAAMKTFCKTSKSLKGFFKDPKNDPRNYGIERDSDLGRELVAAYMQRLSELADTEEQAA
jgi:hypothetical protein